MEGVERSGEENCRLEAKKKPKRRIVGQRKGWRLIRKVKEPGGGGEMDGRLKGSEKYEKGDGIPGPRNKKKL